MTLEEMLAMPKGMKFEEYESLLKDKQRLERQIRKAKAQAKFERIVKKLKG